MTPERIPLFPLEVVLFPGSPLPLHIFEPRYKIMIGRCLDKHLEFGVALARPQGVVAVGCTAEIVDVLKRYADGRMDIITMGRTPFRILELIDEEPYYEARINVFEEDAEDAEPEVQEKLFEAFRRAHGLVHGKPPAALDPDAMLSVSYGLAEELPLDLDYKQTLLETRSERERQRTLLTKLKEMLPKLAYGRHTKQKAGGNGHPPLRA